MKSFTVEAIGYEPVTFRFPDALHPMGVTMDCESHLLITLSFAEANSRPLELFAEKKNGEQKAIDFKPIPAKTPASAQI